MSRELLNDAIAAWGVFSSEAAIINIDNEGKSLDRLIQYKDESHSLLRRILATANIRRVITRADINIGLFEDFMTKISKELEEYDSTHNKIHMRNIHRYAEGIKETLITILEDHRQNPPPSELSNDMNQMKLGGRRRRRTHHKRTCRNKRKVYKGRSRRSRK